MLDIVVMDVILFVLSIHFSLLLLKVNRKKKQIKRGRERLILGDYFTTKSLDFKLGHSLERKANQRRDSN